MIHISKDLIARAADGDINAFEEIYRISSGYVYAAAYRVTGKAEDAEEVTQDVFIKVYKNIRKFRMESAFSTWIYRITLNVAIDLYRKRTKERQRNLPFDKYLNPGFKADEKADQHKAMEQLEEKELVRLLLEQIPENQRACVVLKDLEGLRYEQIADVLKIKLNTVRSRLRRGREKFASLYKQKKGKT